VCCTSRFNGGPAVCQNSLPYLWAGLHPPCFFLGVRRVSLLVHLGVYPHTSATTVLASSCFSPLQHTVMPCATQSILFVLLPAATRCKTNTISAPTFVHYCFPTKNPVLCLCLFRAYAFVCWVSSRVYTYIHTKTFTYLCILLDSCRQVPVVAWFQVDARS